MEKVGEDEEKIIEEANNSEKTSSDNEDEKIRDDPLETIEESSMDPSNSNTSTFKDPDFNESDMEEEEKVLEFFRRSSGFIHDVSERNNLPNLDKTREHTSSETEQRNEEIKSSSASSEDTEDSTNSDELDSSLFRYYFDGSLPVSAQTHESSVHEDENKMPLLFPKRRVLQSTSWRNCCGLLELLRAAYT